MFYDDSLTLENRNKLSVYALFLAKLDVIKPLSSKDILIKKQLSQEVRQLFLNHQQNFGILSFLLKQSLGSITFNTNSPLYSFLTDVIYSIDELELQQSFTISPVDMRLVDLNCIVARRFESHMATELINTSSKTLWSVVNKISQEIVSTLKYHQDKYQLTKPKLLEKLYQTFFMDLGPYADEPNFPHLALAFGRFANTPTFKDVIACLEDANDLAQVMLIQFMYMRDVYPDLKLSESKKAEIINKTYAGDFKDFLDSKSKDDLRMFFCNYPKYAPHLYTDRGRIRFEFNSSKNMGIMLSDIDSKNLPKRKQSWFPDCLCNVADLESTYVKELICKLDIPYVAGPSGMTSILSGVLTLLGSLNNTEKQQYTLAIMAFIVGGGLHSTHEVLSVPTIRLGLLPNYKISGIGAGNYGDYFKMFSKSIPEVKNALDSSFDKLITWMKQRYPQECKVAYYGINMTNEHLDAASSKTCCLL